MRGEVWWADLNPVVGREQAGCRPVLVISADIFNEGPTGLVTVIPLTTTQRGTPLHVEITPPEGGLTSVSYAMCEQLRTISKDRLDNRSGSVGREVMATVEDRIKTLLDLP